MDEGSCFGFCFLDFLLKNSWDAKFYVHFTIIIKEEKIENSV